MSLSLSHRCPWSGVVLDCIAPDLCTLTYFEKHQIIEILLIVDFYAFLKMLHFSKLFEIFQNHQLFLVKLLNALNLFEHCMPNTVELDQSILAIKVLRLLYTSDFNVRV